MVDAISQITEEDSVGVIEDENPRERRRASRRRSFNLDGDLIVKSVLERLQADLDARDDWMDMRLKRYGKLRGWLGEKTFPWENASNAHIPIMLTDSLRVQDTLHNAVLAIRPTIQSRATKRTDKEKQDTIDNLIDFQVFAEQNGEQIIGHLIQKFVDDGIFTAYIPWSRETKKIHDVRILPPLDPQEEDEPQLRLIVAEQLFPVVNSIVQVDEFGYDWRVRYLDEEEHPREADVSFFFQDNERVEAHIETSVETYNGPVVIPKSVEDVVAPWRSGNLQPPGPSNPYGAPHFALLDYPDLEEIKRLVKDGSYDLVDEEEMGQIEFLGVTKPTDTNEELKDQKDEMEGVVSHATETTKKVFTRIMMFDRWDIDGDGLQEDVIFWVLKEPGILLRARHLTEMFPGNRVRRPVAEAQFVPVGEDRRYGISLPELTESLHDIIVTVFNQTIDSGTLANTPFFFYRPGAGLKADIMRLWPGEGYPLGNPAQDVFFPNLPNQSQAFGFNLIATAQQYLERITMVGELNLGRVPQGKSSALRTASTTMAILQQGEARPERILRRFFEGLSEIWAQIHELNQRFLPKNKEFRIIGVKPDQEDPYKTIDDISAIRGRFDFEFQASLLNTSPGVVEESLAALGATIMSPLAFQLGLIDAEKAYNYLREVVKAKKMDPDKFLNRPPNLIDTPRMLAEEVILEVMRGSLGDVLPLEDTQTHFQKLVEFANSEQFGFLTEKNTPLLRAHMQKIAGLMRSELEQAQLLEAAGQFSGNGVNGTVPQSSPQIPGVGTNPQLQPNELLDESLPGAGGGANAGS